MIKIHFVIDKTYKSQTLAKSILNQHQSYPPRQCNFFIVLGGDGFMLSTIKKYHTYKKPFYGINCGTVGFLMNRYNNIDIIKKILRSKKITINPINLIAKNKQNKIKKLIAINEVSLFRQSRQTASLNLKIEKKNIIKNLIGDGVLVSTPAGSTAYNLSVHGPILSLNSGKIAITPISPFRPRRWKGVVISNKLSVKIFNLNPSKRPVAAVADNIEVRDIKQITIKINKKINIDLLYDKSRSLIKRIRYEQLKKKIS
ncbi:NAD kinase [Pelagibacteraceae bacterium]|nr:NAD kinase [Pelagibacteraceae bacterium]